MGALMSRLWADIMQYMGWVAVPSGYGTQRISNVEDEPSDSTEVMETGFAPQNSGESPEGSIVRQRLKKSPAKGERSPKKIDSTSPVKSTWNDVTEHPKPKLEIAPPNKKTKTESDQKCSSPQEDMQFESVPNLHFGDKDETYCPESLSPDYLTPPLNSDTSEQNGHAGDDKNAQNFEFVEEAAAPPDHPGHEEPEIESHSEEDKVENGDNMMLDSPNESEYIDVRQSVVSSGGKEQDNLASGEKSKSLISNESPCDTVVADNGKDSIDPDVPKIVVSVDRDTNGSVAQKEEDSEVTPQVMKGEKSCEIAVKDMKSESLPLEVSNDVVITTESSKESQNVVMDDQGTGGSSETNGEENKASGDNTQHETINGKAENGSEKIPPEGSVEQEYDAHIGNGEKIDCTEQNSTHDANILNNGKMLSSVEQNTNVEMYAHKNSDEENSENVDPNIQKVDKSAAKTKQICVQWTGEAENVFITGSWLDWKDKVELQKSDENIWSVSLDVKENIKEIEMKFIVDGNWLISPDIPTVDDGSGNRNNYIKLVH